MMILCNFFLCIFLIFKLSSLFGFSELQKLNLLNESHVHDSERRLLTDLISSESSDFNYIFVGTELSFHCYQHQGTEQTHINMAYCNSDNSESLLPQES